MSFFKAKKKNEEVRLRIEDYEKTPLTSESDSLYYPQPEYFSRKRSKIEKICSCIFDRIRFLGRFTYTHKTYLTNHEVSCFNLLIEKCTKPFDESNSAHEVLLGKVLEVSKNTVEDQTKSMSLWRVIGFQSDNPRTDFRAGGIHSLKFILFFIRNYNSEFEELIKLDYFLFAVVAIKISVSIFSLFSIWLDCSWEFMREEPKQNILPH